MFKAILILVMVLITTYALAQETYTKADENTITITKPITASLTLDQINARLAELDEQDTQNTYRYNVTKDYIDKTKAELLKYKSEAEKLGVVAKVVPVAEEIKTE